MNFAAARAVVTRGRSPASLLDGRDRGGGPAQPPGEHVRWSDLQEHVATALQQFPDCGRELRGRVGLPLSVAIVKIGMSQLLTSDRADHGDTRRLVADLAGDDRERRPDGLRVRTGPWRPPYSAPSVNSARQAAGR